MNAVRPARIRNVRNRFLFCFLPFLIVSAPRLAVGRPPETPEKAGPIVLLRVRDAETGKPITGMIVHVEGWLYRVAVTDARGVARFRSPLQKAALYLTEGGSAHVIEPAPGYEWRREVTDNDAALVRWEVKTYSVTGRFRYRKFSGVLYRQDGEWAAGIKIVIIRRNDNELSAMTDEAGRFAFFLPRMSGDEDAARAILLLARQGKERAVKFLRAEESWGRFSIRMTDAKSSLTGIIVDANGLPQARTPLLYYENFDLRSNASLQPIGGGATDAHGRFVLDGLRPEGYYRIRLGGPVEYAPHPLAYGTLWLPALGAAPLTVRANQRSELGRIVLPKATAPVSGRLIPSDSEKRYYIVHLEGAFTTQTEVPNAEGGFTFRLVTPEPLILRVFSSYSSDIFSTDPNGDNVVYSGPVRAGEINLKIPLSSPPPFVSRP